MLKLEAHLKLHFKSLGALILLLLLARQEYESEILEKLLCETCLLNGI